MKICIIGAGPAGMTAGYQLSKALKRGKMASVDIYEAESSVGGLAKSLRLWDQTVDIGPHRFFSSDTRVNQFWLEVVDGQYEMVKRVTRMFYKNRLFYYPLKPFNALFNLGVFEAIRCMASYLKIKIVPVKLDGSFETWMTSRFGKRLYQIFFKTYSERLWGIKCAELDADFASQRIKKLSLYEAVKNAILGGKANKHKTLVDQFAYPLGGTGMFCTQMAEAFRQNKGNLFVNTCVKAVIKNGNKVTGIELENGEQRAYDIVITSMPLSLMVTRLPGVPQYISDLALKLRYRNTILVYLEIEHESLFPDQWLYIHSSEVTMGRISNFRNWHPSLNGDRKSTILCLEYWCNSEDDLWKKPDKKIIDFAKKEIELSGLTKKAPVKNGFVYKIPRSYPVYFKGYKQILKPVEEYLTTIENLCVIGRYGTYKYNNQDHSVLMGLLAADNILENRGHNLWDVNTDYQDYQESSVTTKTGLSPAD